MAPKNRHHWTAFEQHTLLCLLCRQIQITGTTSPSPIRKGGRTKRIFSLSSSIKHAHHDVADLLNRSLNYENHANDIPAKEVSAMIDRLLEERKDAVRYLDRQKVGRITRAMKRVWERGFKVDGVGSGGPRSAGGGLESEEMTAEKANAMNSRDNAAAGAQEEDGAIAEESNDRVLASGIDAQGDDDPWGDNVAAPSAISETDPRGDKAMTTFADVHGTGDPWNPANVVALSGDAQNANDPWGPAESTFINTTSSDDPWGSQYSTDPIAINTTISDDPWAFWTTFNAADANNTGSNEPVADTSAAFVGNADSYFVSSQAQPMASATTAPKSLSQQKEEFTSMNSERLVMLDACEEFEEEIVQEPTYASKGKGENAVELPFNRLALLNTKNKFETIAKNINQDSEVGGEN